jgi:4-amino-4-deoxy-L-arabinose transferase-like glycosyltransferase
MRLRTLVAAGLSLLVVASITAAWAVWRQPPPGLQAAVFRSPGFDGLPVFAQADTELSIDRLAERAGVPAGQPYGVQWSGWIFVPATGRYAYDLAVDDGVEIWVGDRTIVAINGPPGIYHRRGFVEVAAGLHPVEIRYRQLLGDRRFSFTWAPAADRRQLAMPTFFQPTTPPPSSLIARAAHWLPLWVAVGWSATILAGGFTLFLRLTRVGRDASPLLQGAGWVLLAVPVMLIAANLEWGLFPHTLWHPDELAPADIVDAVEHWFAGGWFMLYPPVQAVIDAVVLSPIFVAKWAGALSLHRADVHATMHLGMRVITVVMAVATLLVGYVVGRETVGERAAAFGVFVAGCAQAFVYYGRTANVDVPYVLWVSLALLYFVRAVRHRRLRDHAALGVATALAVATKDQAYGFFLGPALVLVFCCWRDHAALTRLRRVVWTLLDLRLWAGVATTMAVAVLGFGVLWNYDGFLSHIAEATGYRVQGYRLFDAGLAGQLQLLAYSAQLMPWAFGVVAMALVAIGVLAAWRGPTLRAMWLLLVPVVSYYVSVIMLVGYTYDRFFVGYVIPIGLFAAAGFEWLDQRSRSRLWRGALATGCAIGIVAPPILLDVNMRFSSKIALERWLKAEAGDDPLILAIANPIYLPRLAPYRHSILNMVEDTMVDRNADLIVLNEEWVARVPQPRSEIEALLHRASYEEVYRDMTPPPSWSVLVSGIPPESSTNLNKVSPSFTVWRRGQTPDSNINHP